MLLDIVEEYYGRGIWMSTSFAGKLEQRMRQQSLQTCDKLPSRIERQNRKEEDFGVNSQAQPRMVS